MNRLARFTFSFLAVAVACGYEAWQGFSGRRPAREPLWNAALAAAAVVATVFFLAAVKQRHGGADR